MNYERELEKAKKYLIAIDKTYKYLLKNNAEQKNQNAVKEQEKLFDILTEQKGKAIDKYNRGTEKNIKAFNTIINSDDLNKKIKNMLMQDNAGYFDRSMISDILSVADRISLGEALNGLSHEYIKTIREIEQYKRFIAYGQQKEDLSEKPITKSVIENNKSEYNEIEENANKIANGPKKNKLFGGDENGYDMCYLYGLSMDILVLMDRDQHVTVNSTLQKEDKKVSNTYILSTSGELEYKQAQIFKAYGVDSLSSLLNKYGEIRNQYFEKYNRLPEAMKQKYAFSDSRVNPSLSSAQSLCEAYQNENFSFPPSKDDLIGLMNSRIINGKRYKLAEPKINKEYRKGDPLDILNYNEVLEYYNNLAKNMETADIAKLYSSVISSIGNIKNNEHYEALIQKMFCELIFNRSKIKTSDMNQLETHLSEIAERVLHEKAKFSVRDLTENQEKQRSNTIYKEYLKYYASLENKKTVLSFSKFASQYYGLNSNVNEPETLADDLRRMGK